MSLKKYQNINLKKAREQGFTIVELLIVIIVIAILAALVISAYSGIQAQARESAAKQKAKEAEKALVAYNVENNEWPYDPETALRSNNAVNIDLSQVTVMNGFTLDKSSAFVAPCPSSADADNPPIGMMVGYVPANGDTQDPNTWAIKYLGEAEDINDCL